MNTVPYFLLGMPISFKDICTIYPLSIEKRLSLEERYLGTIFMPYAISEDILLAKGSSIDLFTAILQDNDLLVPFLESLKVFCKSEKIRIERQSGKLYLDESQTEMDSSAFREFSKIIRDWNCIHPITLEAEPVFNTEEGRQQWLKLKELRAKSAKQEDDFLSTMINVVQFGGNSYVDESVIKQWTYWKLANAYSAIINNREYEHSFSCYLQDGKRERVKQHWTERLKPKSNIK